MNIRFPRTKEEFDEILSKPIELPQEPKLNQIAILGEPNAGKSSLVNALIGFKICGESSKQHTTKESMRGVYTEGDVQIELTDTPGCVTSKHVIKQKLQPNFLKDPDYSCNYANIIAILYDCSRRRAEHQLSPQLLKILYKYRDKPSILILTKIDLIKSGITRQMIADKLSGQNSSIRKRPIYGAHPSQEVKRMQMEELFKMTEEKERQEKLKEDPHKEIKPLEPDQKHWPYFSEIFHVSSFENLGIEKLKSYFRKTAYPNPWLRNQHVITDVHPFKILTNIIKSKILDNVSGPAPFNIQVTITEYIVKDNLIEIIAVGKSDNNYYLRSLVGHRGKTIFVISNQIREEFCKLFKCDVNFRLNLELKENLKVDNEKKKEKKISKKERDLI